MTEHESIRGVEALRVLVVDDYEPSLMIARMILGDRNSYRLARTASEARRCAALFQPDVVLYEWDLRGDTGLGLARELRVMARSRRFFIAAISVCDEPEGFRAEELVDEYLIKPIERRALLDFVARELHRWRANP